MGIDSLLAFFTASVVLAFVPGPDNLFVMTQAAMRGQRAALIVVLGLCTGLIVHTSAVALGLAVLFRESELAFQVLKYTGCAYLLYLAWQAWRAPVQASQSQGTTTPVRHHRLYMTGIVMNITNPKVSIFFLAFLPQFVNIQAGHVTLQLYLLGAVFMVATLLAFSAMAVLAAHAGARLFRSARGRRIMNRLAAILFVGLAFRLAISEA